MNKMSAKVIIALIAIVSFILFLASVYGYKTQYNAPPEVFATLLVSNSIILFEHGKIENRNQSLEQVPECYFFPAFNFYKPHRANGLSNRRWWNRSNVASVNCRYIIDIVDVINSYI